MHNSSNWCWFKLMLRTCEGMQLFREQWSEGRSGVRANEKRETQIKHESASREVGELNTCRIRCTQRREVCSRAPDRQLTFSSLQNQ